MGVVTAGYELKLKVSGSRMMKGVFLDSHNLWPKLMPEAVKSVEFSDGDCVSGSIQIINFVEGYELKYLKYKMNEVDAANYSCKITLIEGDGLGDKFASIDMEIKFEDEDISSAGAAGAGCVCKVTNHYHTKMNIDEAVAEQEFKTRHDKGTGFFNVVAAYLFANPDVYA